MNVLPPSDPGGFSPVSANFKHSMTVVFPQPFSPTISVNGDEKLIFCKVFVDKLMVKIILKIDDEITHLFVFFLGSERTNTSNHKFING